MKAKLILAGLVVFASLLGAGQSMSDLAKASSSPINLRCARVATGGFNEVVWQADDGSSGRDIGRSLTYDCTLRWSGRFATNALLQVYYIAKPAVGGNDFVIEEQRYLFPLISGSNTVIRSISALIGQTQDTYTEFNIRNYAGAKLRGVVVRLHIGGELVRTYCSLSQWQKMSWASNFETALSGK